MNTCLSFLLGGAVVLLLLLLVVAGIALWIRAKLSKTLQGLAEGTPESIHLVPTSVVLPQACLPRAQAFEGLGFSHVGTFGAEELEGLLLDAWLHETRHAYAVVYLHPKAGTWSDIWQRHSDAGGLTVSNMPMGGLLEPLPGWQKVYRKEADEAELWRIFLESPWRVHARLTEPVEAVVLETR